MKLFVYKLRFGQMNRAMIGNIHKKNWFIDEININIFESHDGYHPENIWKETNIIIMV